MQKSPDRIDFEIIRLLRDNARISNKEISAKVGLAPSTCLSRVRNLRRRGTLRGFHAHVNAKDLGVGLQAMIAVRLKRQSHEEDCSI
jgi:DNA-binding Lrp family transcriptional regulator